MLGCLAEKDMATPEYYPLSLNALTNACNQKSNREPVVSYDDATVRTALSGLRDQGFAAFVSEAGSRVEKYKHRLNERFNFTRGELAVLCVLLLRGPQTGGELRQRTDRLHAFQDLDAVQHTLDKLATREPSLVKQLERLPGTKEPRWAHLMSGEPVVEMGEAPSVTHVSPLAERVTQLEIELESLRAEFERFKAQFQ